MEFYKTKDIYLASTLLSLDFHIEKTTKEGGRTFFYFRLEREPFILGDNFSIDKAVKQYWDKTLEVSPLTLFNAFKELKNRIYNQ